MRQSNKYANKISANITLYEATKSATATREGIDNTPNEKQLINMKLLAENIFEPLRRGLGNFPIFIASFFRCLLLNTIIKGADGSQHMAENGAAFDLDADNSEHIYNYQIFNYIYENLEFDQLIWEFGDEINPDWVHASFNKGKNRKEILVAYKVWNVKKEKFETKYKHYAG